MRNMLYYSKNKKIFECRKEFLPYFFIGPMFFLEQKIEFHENRTSCRTAETEVNTSILDNLDYITAELPMCVYNLMSEHSYSIKAFYDKIKTKNINQKPYLLFIVQKKLIKSIKVIFDKLQKTDNWEDLDERLTLKNLLLKFFCVMKLISSTSVLSLKNLLDNVDYKMSYLKKNVNNILEFKSLLIEDIKDEMLD